MISETWDLINQLFVLQVLHETALIEAFNLKAAIEYQLKNCEFPLYVLLLRMAQLCGSVLGFKSERSWLDPSPVESTRILKSLEFRAYLEEARGVVILRERTRTLFRSASLWMPGRNA